MSNPENEKILKPDSAGVEDVPQPVDPIDQLRGAYDGLVDQASDLVDQKTEIDRAITEHERSQVEFAIRFRGTLASLETIIKNVRTSSDREVVEMVYKIFGGVRNEDSIAFFEKMSALRDWAKDKPVDLEAADRASLERDEIEASRVEVTSQIEQLGAVRDQINNIATSALTRVVKTKDVGEKE